MNLQLLDISLEFFEFILLKNREKELLCTLI